MGQSSQDRRASLPGDRPSPLTANSLRGQVTLVTGANSGIGRAIAIALGRSGAAVAVNYFAEPDAARSVVAAIQDKGARALARQANVSREDDVKALFAEVSRKTLPGRPYGWHPIRRIM